MIFTLIGGGAFTCNQYIRMTASAGISTYAGPPAAGDGNATTLPVAGYFSNAWLSTSTAGSAGSNIFTLYINGAPTAIQLILLPGSHSVSYTTPPVSVSAGDVVAWRITGDIAGYTGNISLSVEFTPTN